MAVAVVGELVVAGRELDEALGGDGGEVAGELGVLGQHHRAAGHERVDERLLPHGSSRSPARFAASPLELAADGGGGLPDWISARLLREGRGGEGGKVGFALVEWEEGKGQWGWWGW